MGQSDAVTGSIKKKRTAAYISGVVIGAWWLLN